MTDRAKPIQPTERSQKLAIKILRDLCFTNYSHHEVLRVARKIAKEYEPPTKINKNPDGGAGGGEVLPSQEKVAFSG